LAKIYSVESSELSFKTAQDFMNSIVTHEEEKKDQNGPTIKFLGVMNDDYDVKRQSSILQGKNHVHKLKKDVSGKAFIGIGHDNWNLVLHMIFGVSKSVRNSVQEEAFEINVEDFKRKYCYELIPQRTDR
jgi:hypothetical protein